MSELVRRAATDMRDDVDQSVAVSLQIIVNWGASTLEVTELCPPEKFVVGPAEGEGWEGFSPPEGAFRGAPFELVQVEDNQVWLVVPNEARATVRWAARGQLYSEELLPVPGLLSESTPADGRGARRVLLPMNGRASVHVGGFSFFVHLGERVKLPVGAVAGWVERDVAGYFAASAGLAAGFLGLAAFFMPPLGLTDGEGTEQEQVMLMQQYLQSQAERERLQEPNAGSSSGAASEAASEAAPGEAGKAGTLSAHSPVTRLTRKRDDSAQPSPAMSRAEAIEEARTFGTISILTGSAFSHVSPEFARNSALGEADADKLGSMFGATLGEQAGSGMGTSGIGESGGWGRGVDMGDIRIGDGVPRGARDPGRFIGIGDGPSGGHKVRVPRMRPEGSTIVTGRLPPEVIQRTVRQNFGRLRMCYERGLTRNPNLAGRVAVRFAIDAQGSVIHASAGESSLPDSEVASCVVSAFYGLSFPAREQGIVKVVYPIAFSPE
ncbi:MAG: AgmX/PglI C-terminal domain-containing protein [Polyangiaceae bacterium]|nr:AgmX/PglI C-terminal domain-containing protein [Polyangiaceae bacterium]